MISLVLQFLLNYLFEPSYLCCLGLDPVLSLNDNNLDIHTRHKVKSNKRYVYDHFSLYILNDVMSLLHSLVTSIGKSVLYVPCSKETGKDHLENFNYLFKYIINFMLIVTLKPSPMFRIFHPFIYN